MESSAIASPPPVTKITDARGSRRKDGFEVTMPILFMGLIALAMFTGITVLCIVAVTAESRQARKQAESEAAKALAHHA